MTAHRGSAPSATAATQRWGELVRARLDEIERLRPERGPVGPSFWDQRADRFAARMADRGADEPLIAPLRQAVRASDTVIDVGAGTGRFALALAPHVAEVIAVDPSEGMLEHLRGFATERGLTNVRGEQGHWPDVDVGTADVVVCGYVLPVIADVAPFVRALDAAATRQVFVHLSGHLPDVLHAPFWQHFHGRPRATAPTYLDAAAVLAEQGLDPHVNVVETPVRARFADLDEAVADFRDNLVLPETADVVTTLTSMLSAWLVDDGAGALRPPMATLPAATLSWHTERQR